MKKLKLIMLLILSIVAVALVATACGDIDASCDHDYELTGYATAPSCTVGGVGIFRCRLCKKEIKQNVEALGHKSSDAGVTVPATCFSYGGVSHICDVCKQNFIDPATQVAMLPHTPVEDKGWPTSCKAPGMTDGSHCDVCKSVIVKQVEIPQIPHDFEILVKGEPATCLESGMTDKVRCKLCDTVFEQEFIPALGHKDENDDDFCENCEELLTEGMTHITDLNGFLAIGANLSGKYILDQDISLQSVENWTPLDEGSSFSGRLYGNGHKISDLNLFNAGHIDSIFAQGLFKCNAGVIQGLTIENFYAAIGSGNGNIGAIAAENRGRIADCTVKKFSGKEGLGGTQSMGVFGDDEISYDGFCNIGGVTGKNIGTIENCKVEEFSAYTNSTMQLDVSAAFAPFYKCTLRVVTNYGGIVGLNNGEVKGCTLVGGSEVKISAYSGQNKGTCTTIVTASVGAIVGSGNYGSNCVGLIPNVVQDIKGSAQLNLTKKGASA